jgi:hypothetical protein
VTYIVSQLIRTLQGMDPDAEIRVSDTVGDITYELGNVIQIGEEEHVSAVVYVCPGIRGRYDGLYGSRENRL